MKICSTNIVVKNVGFFFLFCGTILRVEGQKPVLKTSTVFDTGWMMIDNFESPNPLNEWI